MRILMVCPRLPVPPDTGASIRSFQLIKGLSKTDDIDVAGINYGSLGTDDFDELKKYCGRLYLVPWSKTSRWMQAPAVLKKIARNEPFETKYSDVKEFRVLLKRVTESFPYDIIIIEHSIHAGLIGCLNAAHPARTVLSMHNTGYIQYRRMAAFEKNFYTKLKLFQTWLAMKKWEIEMASVFDKIISVSESDKNFLLSHDRTLDIAVVPNGVDTDSIIPAPLEKREKNIIIVGAMDYHPNSDGVFYFCRRIFPLLKKAEPECTLTIVGKNPPSEIRALQDEKAIRVRADVADVRPYYQKAVAAAVPLRSGGGTRLKILEAMATGTPAVSTAVGCEGLDIEDGRHILVADTPSFFAQRIIDLINDRVLWNRISRRARALVEKNYDWKIISGIYRDILMDLAH